MPSASRTKKPKAPDADLEALKDRYQREIEKLHEEQQAWNDSSKVLGELVDVTKRVQAWQLANALSARDYFAAHALPAVYAHAMVVGCESQDTIIAEAYELADAMVEARKSTGLAPGEEVGSVAARSPR